MATTSAKALSVPKHEDNKLRSPSRDKLHDGSHSGPTKGVSMASGTNLGGSKGGLGALMMIKRNFSRKNLIRGSKAGSTMGGSSSKGGLKRIQMQNTYQLEPNEDNSFNHQKVRLCINQSIKFFTGKGSGYSPIKCMRMSRFISEDIKTRIKKQNFKRYKFVVNVMIGQDKEQGLEYATRCVWNTETDNVVTVTHKQKDMFIVVNVFGIYFD